MKNLYKIVSILVISIFFGCNDDFLERYPTTEITEQNFFKSENDLKMYTNGFYESLNPGHSLAYGKDYDTDDMETRNELLSPIETGLIIPSSELGDSGWNWRSLRTINYFLEHYKDNEKLITAEALNHYGGIARFFRAWFYFEKVKNFGDVPWIDKVLNIGDEAIMGARAPRNTVVDFILADLDFAIENLSIEDGYNRINKNTALAFKSRVALFEGTWQKYHNNDASRATSLLTAAKNAAKEVMDSGVYSIYNTGNVDTDYLKVFGAEEANASEAILAKTYISSQGNGHSSNYIFTNTNQGGRQATKEFIDSFLMKDGTFFSTNSGFKEFAYSQEVVGRDPRLAQIIRTPGYMRRGTPFSTDLNFAATGYQIIKYVTDDSGDEYQQNTNDYIIIRYAEVLLNYAEAAAEMGSITNNDLDISINHLRSRAGLPNLATNVALDPTLDNLYKNVSNPLILEIRRERRVELCFEGFRLDDIRRWKEGHLLRKTYKGMYIKNIATPFDLNNDGTNDAIVLASADDFDETTMGGLQTIILGEGSENGGSEISLSEGNKGNVILHSDTRAAFEDYQYLYPIPTPEIVLNPNLIQNDGY